MLEVEAEKKVEEKIDVAPVTEVKEVEVKPVDPVEGPSVDQIANILTKAENDPEFAKLPDVVRLVDMAKEQMERKNVQAKATQKPVEVKPIGTNEIKTEAEKKVEENIVIEERKGTDIFNAKKTTSAIKTIEDFNGFIKNVLSINTDEGYNTVANSISTWRKQAQTSAENQSKFDELKNVFTELPGALQGAIQDHSNAIDWRVGLAKQLNGPAFDKSFENNNPTDLVKYYFPQEYKDIMDKYQDPENDEYTEEEMKTSLSPLKTLTKTSFTNDKMKYDSDRATLIREADESTQKFKASLDASVQNVFSQYPDVDSKSVEQAKGLLGGNLLSGLFYDKDGNLLPDAIEKIMYVQQGRDMVKNASSNGARIAATDATLASIEIKDDKIKTSKGSQQQVQEIAPEVREQISLHKYSPLHKTNPFESVPIPQK